MLTAAAVVGRSAITWQRPLVPLVVRDVNDDASRAWY